MEAVICGRNQIVQLITPLRADISFRKLSHLSAQCFLAGEQINGEDDAEQRCYNAREYRRYRADQDFRNGTDSGGQDLYHLSDFGFPVNILITDIK